MVPVGKENMTPVVAKFLLGLAPPHHISVYVTIGILTVTYSKSICFGDISQELPLILPQVHKKRCALRLVFCK